MSFAPPTTTSSMLFLRLFFFFFVSLHKVAFGDLTINTPQDLIDFSNDVSSGSNYSGTTVYLATDLGFGSSFSQQFQPIGNETYPFRGTFDGQGHIIKNLNLSSSLQFVGLFGFLSRASIRNVILDESCSFTSFSSNSNSDVGSVAGYCYLTSIENVVNMASVTFAGSKSVSGLRISGIVTRLLSSSTIKNCVNHGPVTYSGTSTDTHIGGIAGLCGGSPGNIVQNCANYGTLMHNGTSAYLYFGGITGISFAGTNKFENCVSAGKIINATQGSTSNYVGGVAGLIYSGTTNVTHCLWTSNVGCSDAYGYKDSSATVTVTSSKLASLDATAMGELNEYAETNSWDKWFMLHLMGGTINNITQDTLIVTQKHFPVPVKEGSTFSFWCMDAECADVYGPDTTDITAITDLYAGWDVYTVAFEFGNGTTETKNVFYDEKYGTLPGAGERAGWTFIGWSTGDDGSGDEITSETTVSIADDHALYAQWTINNYTLRFILNNGESDVVKTLNYSDPIYYPNDPVREGYIFNGWSENTTAMPAHNLNITAQWTKIYTNVTEYVEIVFAKRDLSEDDVKTIIRKYADGDNFVIANIETVNGETKVIVKFTDTSKAEEFVRNVNENKRTEDQIKITRYISNYDSASSVPHVARPFVLIRFLLLIKYIIYEHSNLISILFVN